MMKRCITIHFLLFMFVFCSSTIQTVPEFRPDSDGSKPRILILISSADHVVLSDGSKNPSGYFLSELTDPAELFLKAGLEIDIATPDGNPPVIDEAGLKLAYFGLSNDRRKNALELADSLEGLKKPIDLRTMTEVDFVRYRALYIPGGQAPMTDLSHNEHVGKLLHHFHKNKKPTGLICHGPVALLSAKMPDQDWIYRGYRMTSVTKSADKFAEWFGSVDGSLPFYVNEALTEAGGKLQHTLLPAGSLVVVDRELVTGQDPFSVEEFGYRFLEEIRKRYQ